MAFSGLWQRASFPAPLPEWEEPASSSPMRAIRRTSTYWIILDALTVTAAATAATLFELRIGLMEGIRGFYHGTLIHGQSMSILLAMLFGFMAALIETSRRMHLYTPSRLSSLLHEQRLTFQACFVSGLLLTGTLYLTHAFEIQRSIVMITLGLVMVSLSVRRFVFRLQMYRRLERGIGTCNVIIVGTGPEARALRRHIDAVRHLGYSFKGFIESPAIVTRFGAVPQNDVLGTFDSLFEQARKNFADEIFITGPCERGIVTEVYEKARMQGLDLRVVPDMYDGLAWNREIEYVGQFPTIPLHRGHVPELALLLKRLLDVLISSFALLVLSPILLAIAVCIKLSSPGPVFYVSERIGKKGRVFGCRKFRTMVQDAEKLRADILYMNERDGVLFKVTNDPRVTKIGRFLRKYSLDEIPQFWNVLVGDMSIVGPRPPIASEVREYELKHLRRLDVTPGITGLWQVQSRQDPSFDSYILLDMTYIENWSVWLDVKIILRTVGVVFAGTGS